MSIHWGDVLKTIFATAAPIISQSAGFPIGSLAGVTLTTIISQIDKNSKVGEIIDRVRNDAKMQSKIAELDAFIKTLEADLAKQPIEQKAA